MKTFAQEEVSKEICRRSTIKKEEIQKCEIQEYRTEYWESHGDYSEYMAF